jgi:hypothetical protein
MAFVVVLDHLALFFADAGNSAILETSETDRTEDSAKPVDTRLVG